MRKIITNTNENIFIDTLTEKMYSVKPTFNKDDILIKEDSYFKGTDSSFKKVYAKEKKLEQLNQKINELSRQSRALSEEIKKDYNNINNKVLDKYKKKSEIGYEREIDVIFKKYINKNLTPILNPDEKRWPEEGAFGGSLYYEYDHQMMYDDEIFEKNYAPLYDSVIKRESEKLIELNKKLRKTGYIVKPYIYLSFGDGRAQSIIDFDIYHIDGSELQAIKETKRKIIKKIEKILLG